MEPLEHLTRQLRELSLEVPADATEKLLRLLDELCAGTVPITRPLLPIRSRE
jgi:hypothetical protein